MGTPELDRSGSSLGTHYFRVASEVGGEGPVGLSL